MTTLSDGRKLVVEPAAGTPKGVVLLIPGGSTTLSLAADGSTSSNNFVIRTRRMLGAAGYTTAYLDDPADLREPLVRLRELGRPVVVLSTSRGTVVAEANAAKLGADGPDLLVLTSPVTRGAGSLAGRALPIPTLVTANANDGCSASPPDGAAELARRLGARATFLAFSSTEQRSDPCQALSPHGYLGIESEVIGKIVDWIVSHAGSRPT